MYFLLLCLNSIHFITVLHVDLLERLTNITRSKDVFTKNHVTTKISDNKDSTRNIHTCSEGGHAILDDCCQSLWGQSQHLPKISSICVVQRPTLLRLTPHTVVPYNWCFFNSLSCTTKFNNSRVHPCLITVEVMLCEISHLNIVEQKLKKC